MALTSLAEVMLAARDLTAARRPSSRHVSWSRPNRSGASPSGELEDVEIRVGHDAVRAARRPGVLVEELTDREHSILRMLSGTASQREIGAALYLSINTVKGYAKSLYRKLDATTRQEAVERARELNLL